MAILLNPVKIRICGHLVQIRRCSLLSARVRPSVRPGFLLCAVLGNSSTPPDFMLFSYLVSTMLLGCKSEFMVLIAYKSGNLDVRFNVVFAISML